MLTRRFFPIKTPELVNSASNHEQTSANPYFQNTPGRYANYSRGLIKRKKKFLMNSMSFPLVTVCQKICAIDLQ